MYQEIKDEILDPSLQPDENDRYTIKNNKGVVIHDDVQIEMKTPVVQNPTPFNRATMGNIQGDLYTLYRYNTPSYSLTKRGLVSGNYYTDYSFETFSLLNCSESSNDSLASLLLGYDLGTNPITILGTEGNTGSIIIKNYNQVRLNEFYIKGYYSENTFNPQNFTISGSQNGTSWTTLLTNTVEITTAGKTFTITNTGYYKYFKFDFTFRAGRVVIAEMRISKYEVQDYTFELNIPLTSYESGKIVNIMSPVTVSKTTLNINKLGAKNINASLRANEKYSLIYNGNSWDISDGLTDTIEFNGVTELEVSGLNIRNINDYLFSLVTTEENIIKIVVNDDVSEEYKQTSDSGYDSGTSGTHWGLGLSTSKGIANFRLGIVNDSPIIIGRLNGTEGSARQEIIGGQLNRVYSSISKFKLTFTNANSGTLTIYRR